MSYTIRPMTLKDVPWIVAIERRSFPSPWPASAFQHELHQKRSSYSVLLKPGTDEPVTPEHKVLRWLHRLLNPSQGSPVVGYVGFRLEDSEAHVTTIAVHPDWRGRKLGELLLLTVIEKAVKMGAHVMTLEMRPSNRVAHRLYRKYGFRVKGRRRNYYRNGEDALTMAVQMNVNGYQERLDKLGRELERRFRRQYTDGGQGAEYTL